MAWVNCDFKQLSTKISALIVGADELVKQDEILLASLAECVKQSSDLVVLSARVVERTREVLQKLDDDVEPLIEEGV